ncbi:MAG TPA: OmpH family outer membrane protein [Urbifossiella sp.]|nr:OmpH family outer membrane protein [Urbifossiella sp.]
MVRRIAIAAALVVGCWMVAHADDAPRVARATHTVTAKPAKAETSPEILRAQLDVKKAQVKLAEMALRGARLKLERVRQAGTTDADERAQIDADTAAAQLDVYKAELRETEVRLEQAKKRPADAKGGAGKVAVFNMPAVMRDYDKVKCHLYKLNKLKAEKSVKLILIQEKMTKLKQKIEMTMDADAKEAGSAEFRNLERKYQDEKANVDRLLNKAAGEMITSLYDAIKTVVDETAAENGYVLVLSYPDAANHNEMANPAIKEMKLKPPAAQPFFVDRSVDITQLVIKKLNADYPPVDASGEKVDVSKLPMATATPPAIRKD